MLLLTENTRRIIRVIWSIKKTPLDTTRRRLSGGSYFHGYRLFRTPSDDSEPTTEAVFDALHDANFDGRNFVLIGRPRLEAWVWITTFL